MERERKSKRERERESSNNVPYTHEPKGGYHTILYVFNWSRTGNKS